MRWCCWRCWWRLPSPRWESCWWWWWRWFPPPGGKFPRRNRSAGGQKCSCPSSASRWRRSVLKVLPLFFRSKWLIYQKMGTRGGPGWAQPTRARLGSLARPGGLCPPGGPPLVVICSNISYIFHKNSPWSCCSFGVVRNRWPDVAFPGLDFQLSDFSLFVYTLHIMREKALELLQKALLWIKTL